MITSLFAASAVNIGKGIGLLFVWIDDRLRRHYCGKVSDLFPSANPLFYDREFIWNLKVRKDGND